MTSVDRFIRGRRPRFTLTSTAELIHIPASTATNPRIMSQQGRMAWLLEPMFTLT